MTTQGLVVEGLVGQPSWGKQRTEYFVSLPEPEFERFFLRHYDHVVRSLTAATGDEEMARDCVQEAFVKAAGNWKNVRRYENPTAWVRRVAINRSRDHYRTEQRRRRREERVTPVDAGRVSDSVHFVDGSLQLVALLDSLPLMQRAAAALFYVDDLSVADIAAQLGISAGAVKFHLSRARATLRASLERQGHSRGL